MLTTGEVAAKLGAELAGAQPHAPAELAGEVMAVAEPTAGGDFRDVQLPAGQQFQRGLNAKPDQIVDRQLQLIDVEQDIDQFHVPRVGTIFWPIFACTVLGRE